MAKKKKQPSPKATPRRPQRPSIPSSKKKKGKSKSKTPWLKADGTPNKRYKKIAKYLTKDGKIRKNAKLPFKVKTAKALFNKLYPPAKKLPPWYTKNGTVRKSMLKYLTKTGQLRKGVKLPKGIKTIQQLWDWVQSGKVKDKEQAEKDGRLLCKTDLWFYWEAKEHIDDNFHKYRKVFMGGEQITYKTWQLNGDDYIDELRNSPDSPNDYTIYMTICKYVKRARIKFLFF